MIKFWFSKTSKRSYDYEVKGAECVEVSVEFITELLSKNTPTDVRLREYVSYENMRKLFFERPLPFEVVAADVIRLLKWSSDDFIKHTGLGKDTYFRITKGKQQNWDPDTTLAFCKGSPIGPLLAIYLLGKAHIDINPWVDAACFDEAYILLMKQGALKDEQIITIKK